MRVIASLAVSLVLAVAGTQAVLGKGPVPVTGTLAVTATVGPTCPVERPGSACDDRPYDGTLRVRSTKRTWRLVMRNGHGHIALPAGRYSLSSMGTLPSLRPVSVSVRARRTTRISARAHCITT